MRAETWPSDRALAQSLSSRWADTLPLQLFEHWPENWSPIQRDCHGNADRWVAQYPQWRVVRGWVRRYGEPGLDAEYAAHSVVMDPDGRLLDVTLLEQPVSGFLEHQGSLDEYLALVSGRWSIVSEL